MSQKYLACCACESGSPTQADIARRRGATTPNAHIPRSPLASASPDTPCDTWIAHPRRSPPVPHAGFCVTPSHVACTCNKWAAGCAQQLASRAVSCSIRSAPRGDMAPSPAPSSLITPQPPTPPSPPPPQVATRGRARVAMARRRVLLLTAAAAECSFIATARARDVASGRRLELKQQLPANGHTHRRAGSRRLHELVVPRAYR